MKKAEPKKRKAQAKVKKPAKLTKNVKTKPVKKKTVTAKAKPKTTANKSKSPFVKGNQFWRLRSKHGRDKLFKTPELLYAAVCDYFQWCDDNPFKEQDFMNSKFGPIEINRNKMRPYTLQGLTSYLNCNVQYFSDFEKAIAGKKDKTSKDFSLVITHIRETIYNQKFSGAAAGFFNANIIARDLGLTDTQKIDHTFTEPITGMKIIKQDGA